MSGVRTDPGRGRGVRGFAMVELAAAIAVVALLAAMLLIMGDSSRRQARLGEDLSNLRRIGTLTRSYASDFGDRMWAFSWRPGNYTTHHPDLQNATNIYDAAGKQAIAIMRDNSTLTNLSVISGWMPHLDYSHLVLQDYAGDRLPHPMFISSGDRNRLLWAADPERFRANGFNPQPLILGNASVRWVFSASFEYPVAFFDQNTGSNRIHQANQHNFYSLAPAAVANLEGVGMNDIAHPSGKVMLHDLNARHFGTRQPSFFMAEARIALLMADGAAGVRLSGDSNVGVDPRTPSSPNGYQILYSPQLWEPPPLTGPAFDIGDGRYRWTRMGIKGRDFGGPAVFP